MATAQIGSFDTCADHLVGNFKTILDPRALLRMTSREEELWGTLGPIPLLIGLRLKQLKQRRLLTDWLIPFLEPRFR